jgi:hypothetical protein
MSLDAAENQVYVLNHGGPHSEEYHTEVYKRLREATEGCKTKQQCRAFLVEELRRISDEVCTPGSKLHRLLTKA